MTETARSKKPPDIPARRQPSGKTIALIQVPNKRLFKLRAAASYLDLHPHRLARTWQAVESELLDAMGGTPTPQERILIGRVCFKLLRCHLYEAAFLNGNGKPQEEKYLALANSLRLDLQALGLERREKKVVDLKAYLQGASEQ